MAVSSSDTALRLGSAALLLLLLTACSGSPGTDAAPPNGLAGPAQPAVSHVYAWANPVAQAAFAGRDGASALVLNGKAWLLGGWRVPNESSGNFIQTGIAGCCTTSEVWSSGDGLNWTLVTVAPWAARHMAGWVAFNGKLWVIGGDDNAGYYQSDVWSSSDGAHWTQVAASVPWAPRVLQYALAFDGRVWIMGGQQVPATLVPRPNPYPATPVYYSDVWTSFDGANWVRVGSLPHALGMICGAVVFQNQMWVIGGGTYGDDTQDAAGVPYNEVWSSSDGFNWTQHPNAPWPARRYHSVAVFDNQIWVMAGIGNDGQPDKNDVWHSPDGANWTQLPSTPWSERHAASAFVFNGSLYFTGGTDNGGIQHNEIWQLAIQPD